MMKEKQMKSPKGPLTSFTLKASSKKDSFYLLALNKSCIGLSKSGTVLLNIAIDSYWCIDMPCRCEQSKFLFYYSSIYNEHPDEITASASG